jgi:hypothetical protein
VWAHYQIKKGMEVPVGQGSKTLEYLDIPSFRNAAGRDASTYKM